MNIYFHHPFCSRGGFKWFHVETHIRTPKWGGWLFRFEFEILNFGIIVWIG